MVWKGDGRTAGEKSHHTDRSGDQKIPRGTGTMMGRRRRAPAVMDWITTAELRMCVTPDIMRRPVAGFDVRPGFFVR
jgi:hypothetical protein